MFLKNSKIIVFTVIKRFNNYKNKIQLTICSIFLTETRNTIIKQIFNCWFVETKIKRVPKCKPLNNYSHPNTCRSQRASHDYVSKRFFEWNSKSSETFTNAGRRYKAVILYFLFQNFRNVFSSQLIFCDTHSDTIRFEMRLAQNCYW